MKTTAFAVAIDIGSTSIKGAVLDLASCRLGAIEREPFPSPVPGRPGHADRRFEIDPQRVVAAVRRVLDKLIAAQPDCEALLLCSQMGGVILADSQGRPLTHYISWRDQRATLPDSQGVSSFQRLMNQLSPADQAELGNELKPGTALSLLFSMKDDNALPRDAIPLGLGDYVLWQLAGRCPPLEPTSAMGLLSIHRLEWHAALFEKLGLPPLRWPRLSSVREAAGTLELYPKCVAYPVIGDHQAALLGTWLELGELSINISTGSQASMLADRIMPGNYQTRPYFDGRYLNTITHLPAGRSLQALVQLLSEFAVAQGVEISDPWPYIAAEAQRANSDLEVDLSFFEGPFGGEGHIRRVTVDNLTVGDLFRAAFVNMANNYAVCATRLSPERRWDRLVLSGGLAKIDTLRQLLVDRFQCPLRICEAVDETLVGLMVLALVVTGRASSVTDATAQVRAH